MGIYIVIGVCATVGVLITFFAIKKVLETIVFIRTAARTEGKVIRLLPSHNSDGHTLYIPVFQYQTNDGKLLQYTSSIASSPPAYHLGASVRLLYQRKNPQHARVDSFSELWLVNLILGVMGIGFLAAAPAVFLAFR